MKKLFSLILGLSLFGLPAVPSVFAGKDDPVAPAAGPRAKRQKFTAEEDAKILALVERYGTKNWNTIAAELGTGATGKQCRDRYNGYLKAVPGEKTEWTEAADQLLLQKVEELGTKWVKIQRFFPGYSAGGLKNRWETVSLRTANHGPFTPEEDAKIPALVAIHGTKNWNTIAAELGTGRTIKQCSERYHNCLEVASGDKRPWNASEDQLLIEKVNELGHVWTELRQFFPGYSANDLRKSWDKVSWRTANHGPFTPEEDAAIKQHVAKVGTRDWATIAPTLNRIPQQCCARYNNYLKGTSREKQPREVAPEEQPQPWEVAPEEQQS